MKYILLLLVTVGIGWYVLKKKTNKMKYLPVNSINMGEEQKKYVLSELKKYEDMLKHDNAYSYIAEAQLTIEKVKNGTLNESDLYTINRFIEVVHDRVKY